MSDESTTPSQDENEDVEAHRRKAKLQVTDSEPRDEAEGEGDDVEAHGRKAKLQ